MQHGEARSASVLDQARARLVESGRLHARLDSEDCVIIFDSVMQMIIPKFTLRHVLL